MGYGKRYNLIRIGDFYKDAITLPGREICGETNGEIGKPSHK